MASKPRVRPSMGMHNLGRGPAALDSKYVSTCKVCRLGIYEKQPHGFYRQPLGLSHDACIEQVES